MIKRAVIVDDDELNNFVCTMVMKTADFAENVQCFLNPVTALDFLKDVINNNPQHFPEVIFVDINMPRVDGWGFLNEYRKFPEEIKSKCSVFMLSSSIDQNDINMAHEQKEIKEYLSKPLALSDLLQIKSRFNI